MPGIEPGASYMQSMRSTTELHPQLEICEKITYFNMLIDFTDSFYFLQINNRNDLLVSFIKYLFVIQHICIFYFTNIIFLLR